MVNFMTEEPDISIPADEKTLMRAFGSVPNGGAVYPSYAEYKLGGRGRATGNQIQRSASDLHHA